MLVIYMYNAKVSINLAQLKPFQNQTREYIIEALQNKNKRWDRPGRIIEVLDNSQYSIRVD